MDQVQKDQQDRNFWIKEGNQHIASPRLRNKNKKRYNSVIDLHTERSMKALFGMIDSKSCNVVDFGCGDGRLTKYFHPDRYLGIDVNEASIGKAESLFPRHIFMQEDHIPPLVKYVDVILFFNVLLHLSETAILSLENLPDLILIGEILKPLREQWEGRTPSYGHSLEDYQGIFSKYSLVKHKKIMSTGYSRAYFSILLFERKG